MRNSDFFSYNVDSYLDYVSLINKKNYLFKATLINPSGVTVDLYKSAIKELYLNDNLFSPFFTGKLVVDNREDAIERYFSDQTKAEFSDYNIILRGYRTRGDGRDLLLLTIIPLLDNNNPYDESSEEFNKEYGLQYRFVLANETDAFDEQGKLKKYDIKDFDLQILSEKKIFFSSSKLLEQKNISNLSNADRSVETGKMLKKILTDGLNSNNLFYYDNNGQTPYFEDGDSKFFYTSPAESTALDDLNYVMDYHVSNSPAKDFSFLKKDNYTGEYTLLSLSNLFKNAYDKQNDAGGGLFTENFTISNAQSVNSVIPNDLKKPRLSFEFGEIGDVKEIKFFNPSGSSYQNKVKTSLVHSHNFNAKQFIINCVDGNIENVKTVFTENYVKPMKGKNDSPAPNLILNNTQKTNQNYDNKFLVYANHSDSLQLALGRNRILKNAFLQNLGIELVVEGSMHRKTGRFISIDRNGTYVDNDFDDKFLGIYLIVNVEHVFVNDEQYFNKIIAIKTYQFKDLKNSEDVI